MDRFEGIEWNRTFDLELYKFTAPEIIDGQWLPGRYIEDFNVCFEPFSPQLIFNHLSQSDFIDPVFQNNFMFESWPFEDNDLLEQGCVLVDDSFKPRNIDSFLEAFPFSDSLALDTLPLNELQNMITGDGSENLKVSQSNETLSEGGDLIENETLEDNEVFSDYDSSQHILFTITTIKDNLKWFSSEKVFRAFNVLFIAFKIEKNDPCSEEITIETEYPVDELSSFVSNFSVCTPLEKIKRLSGIRNDRRKVRENLKKLALGWTKFILKSEEMNNERKYQAISHLRYICFNGKKISEEDFSIFFKECHVTDNMIKSAGRSLIQNCSQI